MVSLSGPCLVSEQSSQNAEVAGLSLGVPPQNPAVPWEPASLHSQAIRFPDLLGFCATGPSIIIPAEPLRVSVSIFISILLWKDTQTLRLIKRKNKRMSWKTMDQPSSLDGIVCKDNLSQVYLSQLSQ